MKKRKRDILLKDQNRNKNMKNERGILHAGVKTY